MRPAISLSLFSCTLLASASATHISRRDAGPAGAFPAPTNKGSCVATLKNANGHNAQHGRSTATWEAKDFGWHVAFPPGATGHSKATLFTGDNCVVTVYVDLDQCTIDGTRFGTPLSGKELHWSSKKNAVNNNATGLPTNATFPGNSTIPGANSTLPDNSTFPGIFPLPGSNDTMSTNCTSSSDNLTTSCDNSTISGNSSAPSPGFLPLPDPNLPSSNATGTDPNAPQSPLPSTNLTSPNTTAADPNAPQSPLPDLNSTFPNTTAADPNAPQSSLPDTNSTFPNTTATNPDGTQSGVLQPNSTSPLENGQGDNQGKGDHDREDGTDYDEDTLIGPVYWRHGCSEGMKVHVDF